MDRGPESASNAGAVTGLAENPAEAKKLVFVCMNVDCRVRGASEVMERLSTRVQNECSQANGGAGADNPCGNVDVRPYMCFGGCHDGPNVIVYPDRVWYAEVKLEDADKIVDQHLKKGEIVKPLTGKIEKGLEDMIFNLLDFGIY